jgi:hypothetical protein
MQSNPNYSAHVRERIRDLVPAYRRIGHPGDAHGLEIWGEAVDRSVKYVLPPAGLYISGDGNLPPGILPQRLPFPEISLEVPCPASIGGDGQSTSSRRHVLCREMNVVQGPNGVSVDTAPAEPEGYLLSIFAWLDHRREWTPQPFGAYVRYDVAVGGPDEAKTANERRRSTYAFHSLPLLPETRDRLMRAQGAQRILDTIPGDTANEVRMSIEFLQVLACRNVVQRTHEPPEALNRARLRRGKTPFDVCRTLTVGDVELGRPSQCREDAVGFQMREHLRSGHIRRLSDHQVWIMDTIVAAGSPLGRVHKDYRIR